jgi:hypothetical protein
MHFPKVSIGHKPRFSQDSATINETFFATVQHLKSEFYKTIQAQLHVGRTLELNDDPSSSDFLPSLPTMHKVSVVLLNQF